MKASLSPFYHENMIPEACLHLSILRVRGRTRIELPSSCFKCGIQITSSFPTQCATGPRFVFGEFSCNIVKFRTSFQLGKCFLFLCMFLALLCQFSGTETVADEPTSMCLTLTFWAPLTLPSFAPLSSDPLAAFPLSVLAFAIACLSSRTPRNLQGAYTILTQVILLLLLIGDDAKSETICMLLSQQTRCFVLLSCFV